MSLDVAILGFLNERPRSGYELKKRCFEGPIGTFWTADQAQIYRTLERLKDAKLVSATRRRQTSRPDRRIYEITRAGRENLAEQLARTSPLAPLRDPLLVQLYFSAELTNEGLLLVLETRREEHQARLDDLRRRSSELASEEGLPPRDSVLKQTSLDGAMAQHRAIIDWLDECIDAVRDGALPGSEEGTGQRHLFGL